jgi:hypothetical protein
MKPFLKMGKLTILDDMKLVDTNYEMVKYCLSTDYVDWKFFIQINRTMANRGFTRNPNSFSLKIDLVRNEKYTNTSHSNLSKTFVNNFDNNCHTFTNTQLWVWRMFGISEEEQISKLEILYEKLKIRGVI